MLAPVVHINGHPGTGKLTIARALHRRMPGARLLDNHTLLDPALALFDRGTEALTALRYEIRAVTFRAARALDPDQALLLTDALDESAEARTLFDDYVGTFVADTKRPLYRFILDIDEAENVARLQAPERAQRRKLMDPEILKEGRATLRILDAGEPGVTHIDVTALSAEAAADMILAKINSGHNNG